MEHSLEGDDWHREDEPAEAQQEDSGEDIFSAAEYGISQDPVRLYLNGIGRVALLDAAAEVELSKRVEAGVYAAYKLGRFDNADDPKRQLDDQEQADLEQLERDGALAKSQMLEANLRLVVSLAKRYTGRGLTFLDVIQEGNLGLIRAVEKFDYTKGYKFSTYATWWIRQSITRGIADQARTIRVPIHMVEQINRADRTRRELTNKLDRDPSDEEVASEMSLTVEKIAELRSYDKLTVSIDMPIGDDIKDDLGSIIRDDDALDPIESVSRGMMYDKLHKLVDSLGPSREADIIRLRFGLADSQPWTIKRVAAKYHLSPERVRQIERKTMARLRASEQAEALRGYLD